MERRCLTLHEINRADRMGVSLVDFEAVLGKLVFPSSNIKDVEALQLQLKMSFKFNC